MASLPHGYPLLAEGVKRMLTLNLKKHEACERLRATVHIGCVEG